MSSGIEKAARRLNVLSKSINGVFYKLSALAAGLMVIPTVLDVFCRFLFDKSLIGAMELVEFCMVILVFSCLGYIQDDRSHIRVTLLTDHFSPRVRDILEAVSTLCPFLLLCLITWCVFQNGMTKSGTNELSGMLGIPLAPFIFYGALGCLIFSLALLANFISVAAGMLSRKMYFSFLCGIMLSILLLSLPFLVRGTELADNYILLGSLGMVILMASILLGMPIGLAMALMGYIGMLVIYPNFKASFSMLGVNPYNVASNYTYTVVPMFILMGELAMYSGISRDLFNAANVWLGRQPGGLGIATVSGCAGFAAVSGDSMATAVTMASVALPEMRKKKYDPGLACATLAAGGTLGILIPPSTGFIFYALVTEVSIGKLFVAGVIPGILLTIMFIAVLLFIAHRHPELSPRGEATTFQEKIRSIRGIFAMVALIFLILGGILLGWFSPNEGGAVGAAGTLLYALCRRRLSWQDFKNALDSTAEVTGRLLLILIGVSILGTFLAATALPYDLADAVVSLHVNRYVLLAAIVLFYIIMGCLMNVIPMILLTLPAIYPTVIELGFDPVWFGVVVVILMEAGQVTPPVGINVFALSSVATDVPMASIFRRVIPFFLAMMFLVFLLTLFPQIALWLPSVLF
ncbi:TRAP transporter large permease subunit [Mailhella massiliensis]|uniref:TRAP transporter large permease n=1 Tax=Mailhella massiliensis TaxID=1903261 RepID=UPI0023F2E886|nr:TRAP transporter large permease subunit [Mailhella massiliensis]